ncbi:MULTISPECIES: phosphotransferase [unclassified Thioalkalivibrio]|uniref:phosphotransferase n=1 Tax=unclassified Thioalkalivibrio TaxID=2621013 RepID=UPI00035F66AC|nr:MULTISPECIES: phosphotransferase [unclassified Thioalkalivibrio]
MTDAPTRFVQQTTGARKAVRDHVIQILWSGYGEIVRYRLEGADVPTVILKHVVFPGNLDHPRGWNNDRSHQRKVGSYQVEMAWYRDGSGQCDASSRVPRCLDTATVGDEHLIVLEDLDAAGFPLRKEHLTRTEARQCLRWLARFHARFMGREPAGLWPEGSYWHLATRPNEWAAIEDPAIRETAAALDAALTGARYRSFVHGDAKVANFCFAPQGDAVAAVDFQYVGGGCGMRDVAYLLGSGLDEHEQETWEAGLLEDYFQALREALNEHGKGAEADAIEHEWRALFPIAQADFYRFLVGWMPDHWKIHDYSRGTALAVVRRLQEGGLPGIPSGTDSSASATSSQ